jgi:citrate lyase subunit beta/citryl-CoA lyase
MPGTPQTDTIRTTSGAHLAAQALTWLFVPGDRPERYMKAVASGADAVIIDLEDAVEAAAKAKARHLVEGFLGEGTAGVFVRINDQSTEYFADDVAMLERAASYEGHGLLGILLPKAETPEGINAVRARFAAAIGLVAIIESASGVHHAHQLATTPGLDRLAFGALDYVLDLGLGPDPRALDHARSVLVLASKVAGLPAPVDAPSLDIKDEAQLRLDATLSRNFGFGGKLCIHPAQLARVVAAYSPSAEELEWAHRVVQVAAEGAAQIDGKMIDRPVIEQARTMLARAEELTTNKDNK